MGDEMCFAIGVVARIRRTFAPLDPYLPTVARSAAQVASGGPGSRRSLQSGDDGADATDN